MSCFTPSSKTSKSSFFRSGMKFPFSSRTITSFVTRSTWTLKVGFSWAAPSGRAGAGCCAARLAPRIRHPTAHNPRSGEPAAMSAMDRKPFVFNLISRGLYIAQRPPGRPRNKNDSGHRRCQASNEQRIVRRFARHLGLARHRQGDARHFSGVGIHDRAGNHPG